MKYKVKKHLKATSVHYKCDNCNEPLNSPIEEAGHQDRCPSCAHPFEVPGKNERALLEMERKAQAIESQHKQKQIKDEAELRLHQQQKNAKLQEKLDARRHAEVRQKELVDNQHQHQLRQSHIEAYRLNLWAWRFFMLGIVLTILGGLGILLQVVALYLAAKASSKSDGVYGERLWRAVKNYFIIVIGIPTILAIAYSISLILDGEDWELGSGILIGLGIYALIGVFLSLQFKQGIKADTK